MFENTVALIDFVVSIALVITAAKWAARAHQPYQGLALRLRHWSHLFGNDRFRAQLLRIFLRPLLEQLDDRLSAFSPH